MNNYRIFETNEYFKEIKKIAASDRTFIEKKLTQYIYPQLKDEPHYGNYIKKLLDYNPKTWRYRIGNYRLFYVIDETKKIIYFLSIDFRKGAY